MVRHTAESYREAAKEHLATAQQLHETGYWGAAHYWSGLAVECMLRAYRMLQDSEFDARHDLRSLARSARFNEYVVQELAAEVAVALGIVCERWSNDLRYRPARLLLRWLQDRGLDSAVRGDRLKFSSRSILDAAEVLVQIGERQWPAR